MNNINSKKYVICVRHGERTDHVGLTPKLYKFDPELTDKGKKQAKEIGTKLRQKLINELNINSDSISIISSPFGRTLQTSKEIIQELNPNNNDISCLSKENIYTIHVNNLLSEYIGGKFCGEIPKDFLSIHTNSLIIREELKHINLDFMNALDKLPTFENKQQCKERMDLLIAQVVDCFFVSENKDAIVLVSHGTPIDLLNSNIKYPGPLGMKHICYCATFIYTYDTLKKEFDFVEKITPDEFNK